MLFSLLIVDSETSRTGVLRAFIERAAFLGVMPNEVSQVCALMMSSFHRNLKFVQSIYSAFGFEADSEKTTLVLCILSVITKEVSLREDYHRPCSTIEHLSS